MFYSLMYVCCMNELPVSTTWFALRCGKLALMASVTVTAAPHVPKGPSRIQPFQAHPRGHPDVAWPLVSLVFSPLGKFSPLNMNCLIETIGWFKRYYHLGIMKTWNMGWTTERSEPKLKREEEPGGMEKTFSGRKKKCITLFSKTVQSYHPIITIRSVIIDQAHYTCQRMALPEVGSHCQAMMIFLNENLINIIVSAQTCHCLIQVWKPGKNNADRWSVISVECPLSLSRTDFSHIMLLWVYSLGKASLCSLDMQSWSNNSLQVRGQSSSRVSFYLQMLSNVLVQLS